MTTSQSLNCWNCGKRLGSIHGKGPMTCAVVVDPMGHEHRVHKCCTRSSVEAGNKVARKHEEVRQ